MKRGRMKRRIKKGRSCSDTHSSNKLIMHVWLPMDLSQFLWLKTEGSGYSEATDLNFVYTFSQLLQNDLDLSQKTLGENKLNILWKNRSVTSSIYFVI